MFEMLTRNDEDAINILKADHQKVKDLFDQFESAETWHQKKKIVADAIRELKVHAALEEGIFYPSVRNAVRNEIMNEAEEEHHVMKLLIAELENMEGTEDHYDAKFKVLSENVRHHIKEEEHEMMPEARDAGIDFEALGQEMLARKRDLMRDGVPVFAEEKMIARSKTRTAAKPSKAGKKAKGAKSAPRQDGKGSAHPHY